MTMQADLTRRFRDEMYQQYLAFIALRRRVQDMQDEINARGGPTGIYGAGSPPAAWPEQPDGFTWAQMVAAFGAITSLVGEPTDAQKEAIIWARRV